MRAAAPGADFTRAYFLLENNVHQQLLRLDETFLKSAGKSRFVSIVKLADAVTREHLALLVEIKTDVDSGKGTPPPGK